jgi:hypothetical protein
MHIIRAQYACNIYIYNMHIVYCEHEQCDVDRLHSIMMCVYTPHYVTPPLGNITITAGCSSHVRHGVPLRRCQGLGSLVTYNMICLCDMSLCDRDLSQRKGFERKYPDL